MTRLCEIADELELLAGPGFPPEAADKARIAGLLREAAEAGAFDRAAEDSLSRCDGDADAMAEELRLWLGNMTCPPSAVGSPLHDVIPLVAAKLREAEAGDEDGHQQRPADDDARSEQAATPQPQRRRQWLASAMMMVRDNPEQSDAKIAEDVGVHKGTLSRSRDYQQAAALARDNREPRQGHVESDHNTGERRGVEAYAEGTDPAEMDWDD